jgi:ribonuclease P protein component
MLSIDAVQKEENLFLFPLDQSNITPLGDTIRFDKSFKLLNSKDFDYLKVESKRIRTLSMMLYYKPTLKDGPKSRLGLSISRKVAKAHDRNRMKRILRESFRLSDCLYEGIDMLVVVSPKIGKVKDHDERDSVLINDFKKILTSLPKTQ